MMTLLVFCGYRIDEMVKVNDDEPDNDYIVGQMANACLGKANAPRHSSLLLYWKERKASLSLLATLARKYLAPPCTTLPSEIRLFSTAGTHCY